MGCKFTLGPSFRCFDFGTSEWVEWTFRSMAWHNEKLALGFGMQLAMKNQTKRVASYWTQNT